MHKPHSNRTFMTIFVAQAKQWTRRSCDLGTCKVQNTSHKSRELFHDDLSNRTVLLSPTYLEHAVFMASKVWDAASPKIHLIRIHLIAFEVAVSRFSSGRWLNFKRR